MSDHVQQLNKVVSNLSACSVKDELPMATSLNLVDGITKLENSSSPGHAELEILATTIGAVTDEDNPKLINNSPDDHEKGKEPQHAVSDNTLAIIDAPESTLVTSYEDDEIPKWTSKTPISEYFKIARLEVITIFRRQEFVMFVVTAVAYNETEVEACSKLYVRWLEYVEALQSVLFKSLKCPKCGEEPKSPKIRFGNKNHIMPAQVERRFKEVMDSFLLIPFDEALWKVNPVEWFENVFPIYEEFEAFYKALVIFPCGRPS